MVQAWEALAEQLDGKAIDPPLWTLARVAHRLNRMALPIKLAELATVYAFDAGGGAPQVEGLRFSTPPAVFDRLRKRGYIDA
jgi:hypothetical protein